jgi:hypothetical protein
MTALNYAGNPGEISQHLAQRSSHARHANALNFALKGGYKHSPPAAYA